MANSEAIEVVDLTSSDAQYMSEFDDDMLEQTDNTLFEETPGSAPSVFGNLGLFYNVFSF